MRHEDDGYQFPSDFLWGVGNSAYQSEGGYDADGKGESIWDRYCHIPGNIIDGTSGDVATDFYHRYRDDIALMRELGVKHYRMSIAWSRVFPKGFGEVNRLGLDFYHRVIDCLIEHDIQPMVTLYWWDLPQSLQDMGGWANRQTAYYFNEFAKLVFTEFGDKVKNYITLDEPYCCAFIGHHLGTYAPGHRDFSEALLASYHMLLAHGMAVKSFRESRIGGKIGIALNLSDCQPATEKAEDIFATNLADGHRNRWFLDPMLKASFPSDLLEYFDRAGVVLPPIHDDDLQVMSERPDFIGLNFYSPHFYVHDESVWPLPYRSVKTGKPQNDIQWEIVPEALYNIMTRIVNDYGDIDLMVTANGSCVNDIIDRNGAIIDLPRIDYMANHIEQVARALQDGVRVLGYFAFSFTDNLEWALGYTKRFGLVYVDFNTQQRIVKQSARWFKQVVANNGLSCHHDEGASV